LEFVADTNILFTFFWEGSFSRKLLIKQELDFFSPELALEEVNGHSDEIRKKTGISPGEFTELRRELAIFVEFIPLEEYASLLHEASIISDKDDIDFIALALKLNCPIWSNDRHFKEQSLVRVFSTSELVEYLSDTDVVNF